MGESDGATVRLEASALAAAAAATTSGSRCSSSYTLGLLFIFFVAVLWSGSSVLVQYIYADLTFDSPFFVTYISNVLFALYLPAWAAATSLGMVSNPPWRREGERLRQLFCGCHLCWCCHRNRPVYAPLQPGETAVGGGGGGGGSSINTGAGDSSGEERHGLVREQIPTPPAALYTRAATCSLRSLDQAVCARL